MKRTKNIFSRDLHNLVTLSTLKKKKKKKKKKKTSDNLFDHEYIRHKVITINALYSLHKRYTRDLFINEQGEKKGTFIRVLVTKISIAADSVRKDSEIQRRSTAFRTRVKRRDGLSSKKFDDTFPYITLCLLKIHAKLLSIEVIEHLSRTFVITISFSLVSSQFALRKIGEKEIVK